ncbi:MAG: pyridoxal phosphate-dependent aminotransferase [Planctomycetota bacterium]|nr:pyridoxal phosphate-dependent aminotransferase [Planctomycetota bacterium]
MLFKHAQRTDKIAFSPVRKVLERARQLEAEGRDIVHFEIGEPDFDTPRPISEAAIAALRSNQTHYGPNKGMIALREAIRAKLKSGYGLDYSIEEILVTVGAAEGIMAAMLGYLDPGDEVIVFTPAFMNYVNCANMAGARTIAVPLREEDDFAVRPEALRAAITPRTKMIILNNPHNPSGSVTPAETIQEIADLAVKHNLLVLTDEIYDQIVYDGVQCVSCTAFPGMRKRSIVVNGFSKCYAMTGWRLGYLVVDASLLPPILKIHQYMLACAPTFLQAGVAVAMMDEEVKRAARDMVAEFARRREVLIRGVAAIDRLCVNTPRGAFYAMLNVELTGLTGAVFAMRLLEEAGVATVPCEVFGEGFDNYLRISYATSDERIREGLERLAAFTGKLRA